MLNPALARYVHPDGVRIDNPDRQPILVRCDRCGGSGRDPDQTINRDNDEDRTK
jgi:hypothetical protein